MHQGPQATYFTLAIHDNAVWKRHQKEDLPLFRYALTFGIEQHTGWIHGYSQSQDCICCTDAISRPSAHGEQQLDRTDTREGEFEWPRAEPVEELTLSLQVVKVPKAISILIPRLTGNEHCGCMWTIVHIQAWTLTCNDLFCSQHISYPRQQQDIADRIIEQPELEEPHQEH